MSCPLVLDIQSLRLLVNLLVPRIKKNIREENCSQLRTKVSRAISSWLRFGDGLDGNPRNRGIVQEETMEFSIAMWSDCLGVCVGRVGIVSSHLKQCKIDRFIGVVGYLCASSDPVSDSDDGTMTSSTTRAVSIIRPEVERTSIYQRVWTNGSGIPFSFLYILPSFLPPSVFLPPLPFLPLSLAVNVAQNDGWTNSKKALECFKLFCLLGREQK